MKNLKNNFENELIDKLNEDYNFENNNKNEHQLLPIKMMIFFVLSVMLKVIKI